ncbi:Rne/Rng family ribonuclease [Mesorhizobium sp. BAC0120]|uniref:Rne/Rng family ribonuclease n=1 Tax=Mesorhizobium sp. BAC0120 TaxID=3090670 RepID=UPI00298C6CB2|nr:Rne/Rng family ribonuclease [Mesorhizobium sp. BAC0120]MDW6023891.1 Rne/Rng family ribonuclease [Mesorhizobium sp. BAC0120]
MPNKMLIDASHPEETRVVVTRGNRIEEFDFESQDKKQLKGNIYLARVTRVEPSLQAAFVEYGGNRHGFLAFSEIHPDYYQIPVADRQALLRAEAEAAESEDDEDGETEDRGERNRGRRRRRGGGRHRERDEHHASGESAEAGAENGKAEAADVETESSASADDGAGGSWEETRPEIDAQSQAPEAASSDTDDDDRVADAGDSGPVSAALDPDGSASETSSESADQTSMETFGDAVAADGQTDPEAPKQDRPASMAAVVDADVISEAVKDSAAEEEDTASDNTAVSESESGGVVEVEEIHHSHAEDGEVESVGAEDALDEIRNRRRPVRRNYKIQEVIKRRQILLVQVVKEERGNKGAALTTYLSLAGRYSVLMPNTARGGGISRKITNAQDRKRLKEVVADLDVPQGMGVILRTAGESRTKAEIKRDYEYLMRLWENVRSLTLQSTAPALVYEEGSLIKRSVRDLYNKDIDEILVSGEEGYREAKDFMRMLMPSHAKVVQPYRDTIPIFARNGIEAQLDKMLQPQVTLKSGGYIIINQTEALVSIDVNSGRSTKEHSIEDTALQTNLEAAEEIARQLRLRDLAGLIVIDFIDMEENRNNRAVEKRLKDCLKNDRARIQVGRISHFGLLEMSRQRIRASVLESTMKPCPHCGGTGHVRSDSSVALHVVRAIEEFLLKDSRHHITCKTPAVTALYVLNHKRSTLVEMERRFGVTITLEADETLGAQPYAILRGAVAEKPVTTQDLQPILPAPLEDEDEIEADTVEAAETEAADAQQHAEHDGHGEHRDRKRRRRRRKRGGDRDGEHGAAHGAEPVSSDMHAAEADLVEDRSEENAEADESSDATDHAEGAHKKRRRGKRGGRRNRHHEAAGEDTANEDSSSHRESEDDLPEPAGETEPSASATETERPHAAEEVGGAEAAEEGEMQAPEPRTEKAAEAADEQQAVSAEQAWPEPVTTDEEAPASESDEEEGPIHRTRRRPGSDAAPTEPVVVSSTGSEESRPKKGGWWQRKSFF